MAERAVVGSWDDYQKGERVRFGTPAFVRKGTILRAKGQSLRIKFDGFDRATVLPDGKMYWEAAVREGAKAEWHLVRLIGSTPPAALDDSTMTTRQAARALGCDTKEIRRLLRAGELTGRREEGRWVHVTAESVRARLRSVGTAGRPSL